MSPFRPAMAEAVIRARLAGLDRADRGIRAGTATCRQRAHQLRRRSGVKARAGWLLIDIGVRLAPPRGLPRPTLR
jgi:hypothetical protein